MSDEDVYMNTEALDGAEGALNERGGLSSMKEKFAGIASPAAMFGDVPNGAQAAAALESAAASMLTQLESAGISVGEIAASAGTASAIAVEADAAATESLRIGPHDGWSEGVADGSNPDIVNEHDKFDDPNFVDPMAAFDERMSYEPPPAVIPH